MAKKTASQTAEETDSVAFPSLAQSVELRYEARVGRQIVEFAMPCFLSRLDVDYSHRGFDATIELKRSGAIKRVKAGANG